MPRPWSRLEHSLALLDGYLHPLLGAAEFRELKEMLGEVAEGYDADGRSFMAKRLLALPDLKLPPADLEAYDENIRRNLDRINAARPAGERVTLKYFQYLALLYTEHALHRYFLDRERFLADLNALLPAWNALRRAEDDPFPPFTPADLTKLAYWMATGSGKTLLLHINYLQFLHYHRQAKAKPLDNILLVTPNSGLSDQHLEELAKSGIPAQRFRAGGVGLDRNTVQVLEITKLSEKGAGPLTVHVDSFEGNNLVFVDEGHRGASGDVWIGLRDKLAAEGFTFEYSATFGEALNRGNAAEDIAVRQAYGKAIVFDYSYRYFYGDGYGKDYNILNLPAGYDPGFGDVLLMGNLLAFYEQLRLYAAASDALRPYQIEAPLLVFVGHTVQPGKAQSALTTEDKISLSDVLNMVRFLGRVGRDEDGWAVRTIGEILEGRSQLRDEHGRDIFADRLKTLKGSGLSPDTVYADLLQRICHNGSPGALHLANLRDAPGELGLRLGESDTYFGVINIGDDANFVKMADKAALGLVIESEAIRGSLFSEINQPASAVNVLIGAKKFTEGWNSWRVSAMGLLNVGRSEGSEIVQMFGRGVRLKGRDLSLKRSSALDGSHPAHIGLLETLNIFSINGDYLREFKKALEREGITEGYEEIELPVQYSLFDLEKPALYTVRIRGNLQFGAQPAFRAESVDDKAVVPVIDIRPRITGLASQQVEVAVRADDALVYLEPWVLDLLDWDAIYADMLAWKRQRGFGNLLIGRDALRTVLAEKRYVLRAPESLIRPARFADLPRVQGVALAILKKYTERFYERARASWENRNREYWLLDRSDDIMKPVILSDNRPGYVVKVDRKKPELVEAVRALIAEGQRLYREDLEKLPNVYFDRHLYQPLMAAGHYDGDAFTGVAGIKTVPVALNAGETRFPVRLRDYLHDHPGYLGGRRLYLLRNQSRGRGIGFFEASNFYPDFILWLVDGGKQRIVFVDPKGLFMLEPRSFDHPKIQLYRVLQDIARDLGDPCITLDSFILSDKSYQQTQPGFGNGQHSRADFEQHHVLFPEDKDFARKIVG